MSAPSLARPMTTDEMLAMPENGVDRELLRGLLMEKPVTRRSYPHSWVQAETVGILRNWNKQLPKPRGRVVCGEAGFRLLRDPDTTVGIDLAYISAPLAAATPRKARLIDGVPILAVEILSPTDSHEDISEKIDLYLEAGVAVVWVIDPIHLTITVYRSQASPELFNIRQEISGDPNLPGLRLSLAELFED